MYLARSEAESEKFANVLQHVDERLQTFWLVRHCDRENCDGVGEKCVCLDGSSFAISDSAKKHV